MINIEGKDLDSKHIPTKYLGDLIYFEGPWLSVFEDINKGSNLFLYNWTDNSETCNRWLICNPTKIELLDFLEGNIDLREVFSYGDVFIADIDNNLTITSYKKCAINNLPEDYLPRQGSFYDEDFYTPIAKELRDKLKNELAYKLGHAS